MTTSGIDLSKQVKGNLPVTNLNGGTSATSSTFWRGDGTWATPAGGGGGIGGVSVKTTNYNLAAGDASTLIVANSSSVITFTLPSPPPSGTWAVFVQNEGAALLTISRNTLTIDGQSQDLILHQGQGVAIFTDGTNYFTNRGTSQNGLSFDSHPWTRNAANDEFEGNALSSLWTIDTNTANAIDYSNTIPGSLRVKFTGNQTYTIYQSFVPGSADFSVTAKIMVPGTTSFDSGLLYVGDAHTDPINTAGTNTGVALDWVYSGGMIVQTNKWTTGTRSSGSTAAFPIGSSTMYFHIQRVGGTWSSYYSHDGATFIASPPLTGGYPNPTVAYVMVSFSRYGATTPNIYMAIDWFRMNLMFL